MAVGLFDRQECPRQKQENNANDAYGGDPIGNLCNSDEAIGVNPVCHGTGQAALDTWSHGLAQSSIDVCLQLARADRWDEPSLLTSIESEVAGVVKRRRAEVDI